MSVSVSSTPRIALDRAALGLALTAIAETAAARERPAVPPFPEAAISRLERAGALAATVPQRAVDRAGELALVRDVAAADASVSRILDGHLNAVERLAEQADPALAEAELRGVATGALRLGVWGADPTPGSGEGDPARIEDGRLVGVKTFCSGAGGLQRAIVLVRGPGDERPVRAAYVDLTEGVEVDETWFRGHGMRASCSHRVVFSGAPVLGVIGEAGALLAEPWFSRDAIRTAATWAGAAHSAVAAALTTLRARPARSALEELAAGRMLGALGTIDLWLATGAASEATPRTAALLRDAISGAARTILDEAARACGSRPFAVGDPLDRARRDLELFVLQHRLDPIVAKAGARALDGEEPA